MLLTKGISPKDRIEALYLDVLVRDAVPPDSSFSIALPKGWLLDGPDKAAAPSPDVPVVALARFRPVETSALGLAEGAEIVVWSAFLPREMHGWDWLRAWMASQHLTQLEARQAPTTFGLMGDALATGVHNGVNWLHRMATVKDGNRLFLIDGRTPMTPRATAPELQEIFLMALMRFRLQAPTQRIFAEDFDWAILSGQHPTRFLAPLSWRQRQGGDAPPSGAALLLDNLNGENSMGTMIAILGGPGLSAAEMEATSLTKLAMQGFHFDARANVVSEQTSGDSTIMVMVRDAEREGRRLKLLAARREATAPVSLILITPTEQVDFQAWAINRRAFDIAVDSLD